MLKTYRLYPVKTKFSKPNPTSLRRPFYMPEGCVIALLPEVRSKWIDYSGQENHGTIYGATKVSGRFAEGLYFDGVDDYVNCGNAVSLNPTNAITVELWVKPIGDYTYTYQMFVGKNYGDSWAIARYKASNTFYWCINTIGSGWRNALYGTFIPDNWYHLAMTYDSSTGKWYAYVNGVQSLLGTLSGTIGISSTNLQIGIDITGFYANALIDEVRIYNRALSVDEIKMLYESGKPYH